MIHYGKTPDGELLIRVSPDDVNEIYAIINQATLLQRRTFYRLKAYIEDNYAAYLLYGQGGGRKTSEREVKNG